MAALTESNVYSPSISAVDVNNDVPNGQLANRTLYLKVLVESLQTLVSNLQKSTDSDITGLQKSVNSLQATVNSITADETSNVTLSEKVTALQQEIDNLNTALNTHTHNYAGSSKPGGSADTIAIVEDNVNSIALVGSTDASTGKLRRNSNIYMENSTLHAPTFEGDLEGIAQNAVKLYNNPQITLSGDVVGSARLSGDEDIVINAYIKEQGIAEQNYGALSNSTLSIGGSFTVPEIHVTSAGLISSIRNRTITLPENMGTNGITSSKSTEKKLYVLGAEEQATKASVYTQNGVYINDHALFSNNSEVVNLEDYQQLKNKTYEGYELNDACARAVDETVGGTKDDERLITSNSLYRHTHNYASSETTGGKATYAKILIDNDNKNYLVGNNDSAGILKKNTNVYFQENGLFAPDLTATENMYIPGGKLWIESVEVPVDEAAWSGTADISELTSNYITKTRTVTMDTTRTVYEGTLLAYKKGGYVLATCATEEGCNNIVLTTSDTNSDSVTVMDFGQFDLQSDKYDGYDCYVGTNGNIIYGEPTTTGIYAKKIGYVEGSMLIFDPSKYAFYLK